MREILTTILLAGIVAGAAGDDLPAWDRLDWRLDRGHLVSRYLFQDRQPDAPWEQYAATLGADATPLEDLLAEFDALDAAGRRRARNTASDLVARGRRVMLDAVLPLRDAAQDNERARIGDFSQPTRGFAEAVTTAIDRFAAAVRHDPTNAEAWYHLAYFAGLAGDRDRQERAHQAFLAVWDRQDAATRGRLAGARADVVLDRAWNLREAGRGDECLAWLDAHRDDLPRVAADPAVAPVVEARLITALVHAERGEVALAQAALPHLPLMDVPHRANAPLQTYVHVYNQREVYYQRFHAGEEPIHNLRTDVPTSQADKLARERRSSSYLRRWVKAWTSRGRGLDPATVRRELGRIELEVEFPPRLAWRWWQDQGVLYEWMGETELARVCWARAAVYRPYFIFHPTGQGQGLDGVHGLAGTGQTYFLAYGTFFLSGSLWSYAANVALASEVEQLALERVTLRRLAREHLDACVRRGIRPAAARALRGRLLFLDEDYAAAETELLAAWNELEPREAAPADLALMIGLCSFNREDWTAALPWLGAFTDRSPEAHVGWLARGLAEAKLGRDEEAFASLDRAVTLAPDDPTCVYNRGLLHYRLRRRPQARADFLRARSLWPDNPQIVRMVEVVAEETFYDLQMSVAPVHANLPEEQRRRLAQWRERAALAGPAGELADLVTTDPDQRARIVAELDDRHAAEPTAANRIRLAQALFLDDALDRVEALLAPHWPDELEPVERRLLLYADRARGSEARALAVARQERWRERDEDLELLVLAATILLEHDRREEARTIVERGLTAAPDSAVLRELQRALGADR
jgi:tetratricopeptide (TPR) repeat protein